MNYAYVALLAAVTAAAAPGEVTIITTPNGGAVPDADIGADGTVHVAYVKDRDVFYVKSPDAGQTWSPPLRVNSEPGTSHPAHSFRGPDLAWNTAHGSVHVVWYPTNKHVGGDAEPGLRYAWLGADGKVFERERNLNHRASENFSLAVESNGRITAVWTADGLFTQSDEQNRGFGGPEKVAIADNCECCATRVCYLPGGVLALAYRTKTDNQRDMFLALRKNGTWTQTRISGRPWKIAGCPMTGTYLAPTTTGGVLMALETNGAISWAELEADGTKVREIFVAGASGKYPVVLCAGNGSTCVSWKDGTTLKWQEYLPDGAPSGGIRSRPGANATRHAGVVRKDGGVLLID